MSSAYTVRTYTHGGGRCYVQSFDHIIDAWRVAEGDAQNDKVIRVELFQGSRSLLHIIGDHAYVVVGDNHDGLTAKAKLSYIYTPRYDVEVPDA